MWGIGNGVNQKAMNNNLLGTEEKSLEKKANGALYLHDVVQ